jgi:hypothetical protein
LNKILGLRLAVDGKMGPQTRSAIRSFQKKQGLAADGVVGPQTEAALVKAGSGATAGPVLAMLTQTMKAPSQKMTKTTKAPSQKKTKQGINPYIEGTLWCSRNQDFCEESCKENGISNVDCLENCETAGKLCLDQVERAYGRK